MNVKYFHIALVMWVLAIVPLGFADTFPSRPTLALLDETVVEGTVCGNAVHERSLAVNSGQTFLPYCGRRQPYFASLQQKLESLAPSYINHVSGPLNDDATAFRYFTLATWRSVAGLNANGFRRYDMNGNLVGYGIVQTNDAIGQTLFAELEAGFSDLCWSVRWNAWDNTVWYKGFPIERSPASTGSTPAEAKANAEAAYAADTPIAWVGSYIVPEAYSWVYRISSGNYHAGLVRAYNTATFNFSNLTFNADTIGLYVRGYAYLSGYAGSQIINGQGDGVTANLGLIEEKAYTPGVQFNVIRGWPQPAWPPSDPTSDGAYNTYGYYSQYDTTGNRGHVFTYNKWFDG